MGNKLRAVLTTAHLVLWGIGAAGICWSDGSRELGLALFNVTINALGIGWNLHGFTQYRLWQSLEERQ